MDDIDADVIEIEADDIAARARAASTTPARAQHRAARHAAARAARSRPRRCRSAAARRCSTSAASQAQVERVAREPRGRVRRRDAVSTIAPAAQTRRESTCCAHHRGHDQGGAAAVARPADVRHDRRHPAAADPAVRLRDQLRRARSRAAVVDEAHTLGSRALVARAGGEPGRARVAHRARPSRSCAGGSTPGEISVGVVHPARLRAAPARAAIAPLAQFLVDGSEPMIDERRARARRDAAAARARASDAAQRRERSRSAPNTTPSGARPCRSCRR